MIFIMGYDISNQLDKGNPMPTKPKRYDTKEEADEICDEWVEIEAETLEEAENKYEEAFVAWQKSQGLYQE